MGVKHTHVHLPVVTCTSVLAVWKKKIFSNVHQALSTGDRSGL